MISHSPRIIIIFIITLVLSACTSLAIDAPFVADPAKRKQFVESIEIGKTTISDLTQRWGSVTSAGTAESGNRPDTNYYWTTGYTTNGTGASITVRASHEGVVESVKSVGPNGSDNFKPGGLTAQAQDGSGQQVVGGSPSSTPTPTTSGGEPPKQNTAQAMKAYSLTANATPEGFFNRFGNPDDRETYPDGLEIWTYGRIPFVTYCSAAPFVVVDYNTVSKKFIQIRSNLPGFGC